MSLSSDPFDRTLGAWLETLERPAPDEVTAWVIDRAKTSSQRWSWLARADLAAGLAPLPGPPGATIRAIVLVVLVAAGLLFGVLAGGGTRVRRPDVVPSAPPHTAQPGPSRGLVAPAIAAGSWQAVGGPAMSPSGLAAVRLADGHVLVLGDTVAELDPATGTWTVISQPVVARRSPAVALLSDGRVLVAGGTLPGDGGGRPLATAQLYDPRTDLWTDAGSMASARGFGHSATTLSDGRVLVAGGTEFAGLPSAELFDPETGTWTLTGTLHEAHSGHSATLLRDGRVLVTGGSIYHEVAIASAEVYDPATGTWTLAASMPTERVGHAATLLGDGTVLVTGGHLALMDDGPQASSERFDPVTGQWSDAGSLHVGRYQHTATLLPGGWVLVAGGRTAADRTATAELYDPVAGSWTPASAMRQSRDGPVAVALPDGSVLVVGGNLGGNVATAERFVWPGPP